MTWRGRMRRSFVVAAASLAAAACPFARGAAGTPGGITGAGVAVAEAGLVPAAQAAQLTPAEKRVLDYEIWQMTEELGLSDKEMARIYPRMRRLGEERAALRRERAALLRQIRESSRQGDDGRADRLVAQLRARQEESERRTAAIESGILRELSPRQRAEYVLFRERFAAEMRRLLGEARRGERGRAPKATSPNDRPRRRPYQ